MNEVTNPAPAVPVVAGLTKEEVQQALPANLKSAVTDSLVNQINAIAADPEIAEQVRNNFVSYTTVLKDGKFKLEDYLNAVMYVSYKIMGHSNQDAYARAFPQRYQRLMANGTSSKDIAAYVSAYNKGKLVNLIYEQTLVPSWVLNADIYQKAINTQYELMTDPDVSPKVRTEAANSLLTHLKKPEVGKVQIDLGVVENSGLNDLRKAIEDMSKLQKQAIEGGAELKTIAAAPLIEGEKVENSDASS
jgi:hypothetical protein